MGCTLSEWWAAEGINFLKGIPGSALDPPQSPPQIDECTGEALNLIHGAVLSDDSIICFLRSIPDARESICRMLDTLTPEERVRIQGLIDGPGKYLKPDPKVSNAKFVTAMNGTPQVKTGPGPLPPGDPRRK
jgi:hypothetical protein